MKAAQGASDVADKLIGYTVRAGITAGVNQAVYGQDAGSFGGTFVQRFVASGAADAANWIGGNTPSQSLQNIASHAVLGCAAAVATGSNCGAGAVGGATSALISPLLIDAMAGDDVSARFNGLTLSQQAAVAALSTFAGGVAAQAMGLDAVTAAQAAQNEAINNALRHSTELAKLRQRCGDSGEGGCGLVRRLDGTQTVVEGMPVKGPWQIVAHVDGTGRPVAYSAYNTETRRTDFVMDPQDARQFMTSNAVMFQASSGASYMAAATPAYQQRATEGVFQAATGLASGDFGQARQGLGTVLDSMGAAVQDPGWWLTAGTAVVGGGLARVGTVRAASGEAVVANRGNAVELARGWQTKFPYIAQDPMRPIALQDGKLLAQVVFEADAMPSGSYFTTPSAIRRATLADGSIDANILNQGLQIDASKYSNFRANVQYFGSSDISVGQ